MSQEVELFLKQNGIIELIDRDEFDEVFISAYKTGGIKLLRELIDILQEAEISGLNAYFSEMERNRIMSYFKFHPVGQGLFYTGSIANGYYNFVYDCGGFSGQACRKNAIDEYVNSLSRFNDKKTDIDFVVISHLHADHYNGINYLNSKTNIKRVYLPYIGTNRNFIALVLAGQVYEILQRGYDSDEVYSSLRFMLSLYENVENGDFISYIGKNPNFENSNNAYQQTFLASEYNGKAYWGFTMLNRRVSEIKLQKLEAKMHRVMHKYQVNNIYDLITAGNFQEIAKIYAETIGKNHNISSTVLIHYPLFNFYNATYFANTHNIRDNTASFGRRKYLYEKYYNFVEESQAISTLLTGDVEIDKELADEIRQHLPDEKIGFLQLPHHGSFKNYEQMVSEGLHSDINIASYGLGNKYKHPNRKTVDDLYAKEKKFYSANQYEFFDYWIN